MFELWKEDMTRVRLDENSQVTSYLGKYWIDRTNWTAVDTAYPYAYGAVAVHPQTLFVMFGTTDGQFVAVENLQAGATQKVLNLVASARAGLWIYCFGAKNITTSNSGLQFLDINGDVTFDSQSKWMRFAGVVRNPTYNFEHPVPSGVPTVACAISQRGNWIQPNLVGQYRSFLVMSTGVRLTTASATYRTVPRQGPLATISGTPPRYPTSIIFADVTRY